MHFCSFQVPDHPAPFLQFLRRCRSLSTPDAGPIVVHCSAGVGRTGCYIVIDSMIERMKNEKTIDIYGHVTCLRAQRNYMVSLNDAKYRRRFMYGEMSKLVLYMNRYKLKINTFSYMTRFSKRLFAVIRKFQHVIYIIIYKS